MKVCDIYVHIKTKLLRVILQPSKSIIKIKCHQEFIHGTC